MKRKSCTQKTIFILSRAKTPKLNFNRLILNENWFKSAQCNTIVLVSSSSYVCLLSSRVYWRLKLDGMWVSARAHIIPATFSSFFPVCGERTRRKKAQQWTFWVNIRCQHLSFEKGKTNYYNYGESSVATFLFHHKNVLLCFLSPVSLERRYLFLTNIECQSSFMGTNFNSKNSYFSFFLLSSCWFSVWLRAGMENSGKLFWYVADGRQQRNCRFLYMFYSIFIQFFLFLIGMGEYVHWWGSRKKNKHYLWLWKKSYIDLSQMSGTRTHQPQNKTTKNQIKKTNIKLIKTDAIILMEICIFGMCVCIHIWNSFEILEWLPISTPIKYIHCVLVCALYFCAYFAITAISKTHSKNNL